MVETPTPQPDAVLHLPVERIIPNPLQPRRRFGPKEIEALAASIRQQGLIQPVVVRPHPTRPDDYELVAGERRLRALRHLGQAIIPALLRPVSDEDLLETALVENLQREPLTPIEEAQAYRDLLDLHGYTQDTLARRVGRDRSTIANMIRLLALPPAIQDDVERGLLSVGHARTLLAAPGEDSQMMLRGRVLREGLSVRETERLVRAALDMTQGDFGLGGSLGGAGGLGSPGAGGDKDGKGVGGKNGGKLPAAYAAAQTQLERNLGTRVRVSQDNHAGSVEIEFYSLEDFNRLFDLLSRK